MTSRAFDGGRPLIDPLIDHSTAVGSQVEGCGSPVASEIHIIAEAHAVIEDHVIADVYHSAICGSLLGRGSPSAGFGTHGWIASEPWDGQLFLTQLLRDHDLRNLPWLDGLETGAGWTYEEFIKHFLVLFI